MLFKSSYYLSNISLGSTTSASLLDTLMPTLRNYDDNGILKSTTDQNERLTSFDSFMQGLDQEYDQRKQSKNKSNQRKPSEIKKTITVPPPPPSPLTLDGPIQYLDKKIKKKSTPIKKAKPKPKKQPVIISSSSSDEDEGGETDPSKMIYDEDEAWFESDEEEKRRINDEDEDFYEPKKKKKRSSAKDDGDDQQYYSRLRDFYADQKAPSHSNNSENDDIEIGSGLWIPLSIWNRLFK
jgi:hypothetical protein